MIKQVAIHEEKDRIFFLLQQLYINLTSEKFNKLLLQMLEKGYKIIGYYEEKELVAIAGYNIEVNFYDEEHLYLYDLVSDANRRSKGYGTKLIMALREIAQSHNCQSIVLCSRFDRVDAQRFYTEKLNFEKIRFVIKQQL